MKLTTRLGCMVLCAVPDPAAEVVPETVTVWVWAPAESTPDPVILEPLGLVLNPSVEDE